MSKLSKEEIESVDKLYWSPSERAQAMHNIVEERLQALIKELGESEVPSMWDRLCYAVEFINQQSEGMQDGDLTEISRMLNHWLYSHHYNNAPMIYGPPDKVRVK